MLAYPKTLDKVNLLGTKRIGVTGYKGNLGKELVENWNCYPIDVDITIKASIQEALDNDYFDTVINCAAYTGVDDAETADGNIEAIRVNTVGIGLLALECHDANKRLIHISTDYVFSGEWGPYSENSIPFLSVNKYGTSKMGGEIAIATYGFSDVCVVRTTGLYGGWESDLADFIVCSLTDDEDFYITDELHANQTYIPHLAEGLIYLAEMDKFPRPIIHIASREVISRYEFALMLAERYSLDASLIHPCKNSDLDWVAKRPTKSGLKVSLAEKLGIPIFSIQEGIDDL